MLLSKSLKKIQEQRVISAFKRAAKDIPFYKTCLEHANVDFRKIRNIHDFSAMVPVLDKEKLYSRNLASINDIFPKGGLKKGHSIFPSSGFSGKFSFGLIQKSESKIQGKILDYVLGQIFDTAHKNTLLINALSMGIEIPVTNITTVTTGLRSDIVINTVKAFAAKFDQIIIIGENTFIKRLLEEGLEQGVSWRDLRVHVIFGGESYPESYRAYIEYLLGVRGEKVNDTLVGSSFGFAEIGLNVLWETKKTISIRKKASLDADFHAALLGEYDPVCPMFFQHNPLGTYIEEQNGYLLFTGLDAGIHLPIIRYATGDRGRVVPFPTLKKVLTAFHLEEFLPDFEMPVIAVSGRDQHIAFDGNKVYPDMVKDAFYSVPEIAKLLTGYFRMSKDGDKLRLEFQLKKDTALSRESENRFKDTLRGKINMDFDFKMYPYGEFPYAMELDYERKFRYI